MVNDFVATRLFFFDTRAKKLNRFIERKENTDLKKLAPRTTPGGTPALRRKLELIKGRDDRLAMVSTKILEWLMTLA